MPTISELEASCDYSANLLNKPSFKAGVKQCSCDVINLIVPIICIGAALVLLICGILYISSML